MIVIFNRVEKIMNTVFSNEQIVQERKNETLVQIEIECCWTRSLGLDTAFSQWGK